MCIMWLAGAEPRTSGQEGAFFLNLVEWQESDGLGTFRVARPVKNF